MQSSGGDVSPGRPDASTGSGMAPNIAGALCYFLGLLTGIVFLAIERDRFVRFHAYQSIFLSVAWIALWIALSVITTIVGFIPGIGFLAAILGLLISFGLGLGGFVLWLVLLFKAYQGQSWKLPYIGPMAERYAAPRPAESA